jgi:hypothetical protein
MGGVVETVEKCNLGDGSAPLGAVSHGACTFFEPAAQNVGPDCFPVSFEQLMEPPG